MEQCPPLSRSISGRVAIVTGAASGMGRATAILFASEGAKVAVTDLDLAACSAVVAEIEANGGTAKAFALDVSNHDAIKSVIADVAGEFGGIDILVNNAGISAFCPLDAGDEYDAIWDRAVLILLTAHQRMVRAALPWLRKSDAARIVNIASTEGLGATPGSKDRRNRSHTRYGRRSGQRRHYRQLHLPRSDPYGNDEQCAGR